MGQLFYIISLAAVASLLVSLATVRASDLLMQGRHYENLSLSAKLFRKLLLFDLYERIFKKLNKGNGTSVSSDKRSNSSSSSDSSSI